MGQCERKGIVLGRNDTTLPGLRSQSARLHGVLLMCVCVCVCVPDSADNFPLFSPETCS